MVVAKCHWNYNGKELPKSNKGNHVSLIWLHFMCFDCEFSSRTIGGSQDTANHVKFKSLAWIEHVLLDVMLIKNYDFTICFRTWTECNLQKIKLKHPPKWIRKRSCTSSKGLRIVAYLFRSNKCLDCVRQHIEVERIRKWKIERCALRMLTLFWYSFKKS